MRASRLINILTTLQARGIVTAEALADENEVSVRTIYRDIDALSMAGIPVYSERGSSGGYRLLDGYRVKLNGLSPGEAEAMFLSGLPGPAADLGLGTLMAGAQKKLTAALPEDLRRNATRVQSRFHLDVPRWFDSEEHPQHLQAIADAVWNSKRIRMRYRAWRSEREREAEPLGIVLKGGSWYLVARTDSGIRTFRISRVLDLIVEDRRFARPDDFDLADYWQQSTRRLEADLHTIEVTLRATDLGLAKLRQNILTYARERMRVSDAADADGWWTVTLPAENNPHYAAHFLRYGADVEVLEPPDLRAMIADCVEQLARFYRKPACADPAVGFSPADHI